MKEETKKILYALDNTDTIKKMRKLRLEINKNDEYNSLMMDFIKNQENYKDNSTITKETLSLREKLFNIPEIKQYLTLQNELRLLSVNINNIIISILN